MIDLDRLCADFEAAYNEGRIQLRIRNAAEPDDDLSLSPTYETRPRMPIQITARPRGAEAALVLERDA